MVTSISRRRLKVELQALKRNPPSGIACYEKNDSLSEFSANIIGGDGTCYESGVFDLEIKMSERYPFHPPLIKFETKIYHPNIDAAGRICLDLLKMPPKGSWRPNITLEGLLTAVQTLMAYPNPDDPLMPDIASEYKFNKELFEMKAREWTNKYARMNSIRKLNDNESRSEDEPTLKKQKSE